VYLPSNRRIFLQFALVLPCLDAVLSAAETGKPQVYTPGGDVKPPKVIHYVEPQFSSSSKEAFVEGVVKLSTVVTDEGLPTELHVVSGLNSDEDNKALDAVKQWRFQPGTKSGKAVFVRVNIEIDFHLL
jgi:protein TonB